MTVHPIWPLAAVDTGPTDETEVSVDAEPEFFELSPASAEQVTIQIRTMLERAWEYIAIAYQGRAHLALGYRTWDEYIDARLGDLRLKVPREMRAEAVESLSNARMSLRAIAKILGVGLGTVHRDMSRGESLSAVGPDDAPISVQGRDGKGYRKRRKAPVRACGICGDVHQAGIDECPWDLFAQGRGPRPDTGERQADERASGTGPSDDPPHEASPDHTVVKLVSSTKIDDAVTRAVCIVDELAILPELVDEIEAADRSPSAVRSEAAMTSGVRELIEHLRFHTDLMTNLMTRLERIAGTG